MARLVFQLLAVQLVLLATAFGLFASTKIQHGSKFKLQQKVLTLGSSYTIKDEKDTPVYKVRSHSIVHADAERLFRWDSKPSDWANTFN